MLHWDSVEDIKKFLQPGNDKKKHERNVAIYRVKGETKDIIICFWEYRSELLIEQTHNREDIMGSNNPVYNG